MNGGVGDGLSDHYNPPLDSTFAVWSGINDCRTVGEGDYDLPGDHYRRTWSDCADDSDLFLYVSYDGGHSWPGGHETAIGDPPAAGLNASDRMWTFFLAHPMPGMPVAAERAPVASAPRFVTHVWPNPSREGVRFSISERLERVEIFDVRGRPVRVIWPGALDRRTNSLEWDGRDASGAAVPPGLYLFRMGAEAGRVHHGKLIRIR
jgi:polyhydroxybutyrate depolymerase